MSKIKVLVVYGTRPEAIKMCPLVLELKKRQEIDCKVLVTAQHREMLDSVNSIFGITPDYDLNVMTQGQTLCGIASKIIGGFEAIYKEAKPDIVLVHGDTTTALSSALAAFYCGARVGHVEAGLRSFDKLSPYPEELNRVMISDIADMHFCPTAQNVQNLLKEGVNSGVFITGNTGLDALRYTVTSAYNYKNEDVKRVVNKGSRIILLTAHRRENYGTPHEDIFKAVRKVAIENSDVEIIYPVHPSPAVKDTAKSLLSGIENITLTDPVDMEDMHNLIKESYFVLTDSGGLQEEAPSLGKPVLVLRTETERPEAVTAGTVKISGVNMDDVYNDCIMLLNDETVYNKMAKAVNPYGDGYSSARVADAIINHYRGF